MRSSLPIAVLVCLLAGPGLAFAQAGAAGTTPSPAIPASPAAGAEPSAGKVAEETAEPEEPSE
ncbi:MAG: hypothetical protein WB493_02440, partial [Anaeromyxobacteraceae bacterium]